MRKKSVIEIDRNIENPFKGTFYGYWHESVQVDIIKADQPLKQQHSCVCLYYKKSILVWMGILPILFSRFPSEIFGNF